MRGFSLFAMLSVILTMFGQDEPYSQPMERKALETAYQILKLYYPLGDICFSDSIYDSDWFGFSSEMGKEIDKERYKRNLEKKFVFDEPVYSSILTSVFGDDACECRRHVAEFTAPFKGFIRCEIVPSHDRNPYFGELPVFLFKFNEKGEITQFFRGIMYLL